LKAGWKAVQYLMRRSDTRSALDEFPHGSVGVVCIP
jgi:hypothetical protein